MPTYNGHKNYNYWNVSLWINNDDGLYNLARSYVRVKRTKDIAAQALHDDLHAMGLSHTPDGAPYTVSALRAALVGM